MPKKPKVHLIIPQLFQPLMLWKKADKLELKAPYLTRLLQNYTFKQQPSGGLNARLFSAIGLSTEEELPVANYRYQTHSSTLPLVDGLLLCADPVHLEVGMSDVTLTHKITDLSQAEAKEIINLLNAHFKQDGLTFILGSKSQWYLSMQAREAIRTTPIEEVIGKNIADYPIKSEHRNWHILQNEIQMLLHSATLNQHREMAGLPTLNSLWLWGGGKPETAKNKASLVLSDKPTSGKMLALAAQCPYQKYTLQKLNDEQNHNHPVEFDFAALPQGKTIMINESFVEAAINNDLNAYQLALENLDMHWIKPLYALWKNKKITLQIDSCNEKIITPWVTPGWKFWKKIPDSLSELDL